LSPADFISNVEAVEAFEQSIAELVGVEKEKVLVTGAKQKATARKRRLLAPAGIIIDYTILVEVNDVRPAALEIVVAAVAKSMAAPSFTSSLTTAMSRVPSIPAMVVVPPEPPKMDRVTFEVLRTPGPTLAPTNKIDESIAEESSSSGFLDSTGSKIGLGVGLAFVAIASWYVYHRKKIEVDGNATNEEMTSICKEGLDLEGAETATNDSKVICAFPQSLDREELEAVTARII